LSELILLLALATGLGWQLRRALRRLRPHFATPATTLAGYRTHIAAQFNGELHPIWADCPCCGAPAIDSRAELPVCELCDYEPDGADEDIDAARSNFRRYGSVSAAEQTASWGGRIQEPAEVQLRLEMAELCERARGGDLDAAEWLRKWAEHAEKLAEVIDTHTPP
jgi:hypothetical protein